MLRELKRGGNFERDMGILQTIVIVIEFLGDVENKLQSLWWRVLYIAREISSHLTLFLRRMGNARSRACGMNYPLHTHWVSSGKGQELCWCSVSCRKQLQQRADFSALCPFSLFFHRSPEAHFWCGKFSSLVMSSFSSLFFQFSSALLNEPSLMCDRADQLQIDYFTSGRTISCHLFALLLSSFHFSSHVFHFVIISFLKHIPSTPGEDLHVLKFICSCLWPLLVKETLPLPLLTWLEIKLT